MPAHLKVFPPVCELVDVAVVIEDDVEQGRHALQLQAGAQVVDYPVTSFIVLLSEIKTILYCMSVMPYPFLYSMLLYENGHDFLNKQ